MDIRQLEIFQAVLSMDSNMTRAASSLYLTPAAVSLQIKNLSNELGAELFVKVGASLTPTPAAIRLGTYVSQLMDLVHGIRHDFEANAQEDKRTFVLATALTTLVYDLGPSIRKLRRAFPYAEIVIRAATTKETVRGLVDRQIDIGILVQPGPLEGLEITPLFEEDMKVVVNPHRWPKRGNTITRSEIANLPLILYPTSAATRTLIDDFFRRLQLQPKITMELEDTEAIKRLVESGFGGSILPEHALRRNTSSLRKLDIEGQKLTRRLVLARPKTPFPRKLSVAIADFFKKELEVL
jgi:DNA-binding transcriptional LysR family regulator